MKRLAMCAALLLTPAAALAQQAHGHSPYAGQEAREIKSLSPEDIVELRRGGGWGLAKAAELNGVPGPAHLLELKDRIPLDNGQVDALSALYEDMKGKAIAEGERLIAGERALEDGFRSGKMTDERLLSLLREIEESRARLRFIHLSTHLVTPSILSELQIARYNELRGYAGDPCASVPEGHDAALWRRHNGCD